MDSLRTDRLGATEMLRAQGTTEEATQILLDLTFPQRRSESRSLFFTAM